MEPSSVDHYWANWLRRRARGTMAAGGIQEHVLDLYSNSAHTGRSLILKARREKGVSAFCTSLCCTESWFLGNHG